MTGAVTEGATVRVNVVLTVPPALVAEMVTVLVPVEFGVPVMVPVKVLRLAQPGSPVAP